MGSFSQLVFSAPGHSDPALAIAASRAGAVGIFDGEFATEAAKIEAALDRLERYGRGIYGLRLPVRGFGPVLAGLDAGRASGRWSRLGWLVLGLAEFVELEPSERSLLEGLRRRGVVVLVETHRWLSELVAPVPEEAIDGWLVKGHEASGLVGEETSFILLQKALEGQGRPVYVRGGIGLHSAAACFAGGAAGVALDSQMLLLRESPLAERLEPLLRGAVGNETAAIGDAATGRYIRVLERPNYRHVKALKTRALTEAVTAIYDEIFANVGWDAPERQFMPLGQDIAFADDLADRFGCVAAVVQAIEAAVEVHLRQADGDQIMGAGAPLARSHGTRFAIVQGPMTRVSDNARFAQDVAEAGALPMMALALMRPDKVDELLAETTERLAGKPWGVGLLGFAPAELIAKQTEVALRHRPAFALIAGGRPDQALAMEATGIRSYLHVPSPRLIPMFLEQGARRFVFEGRECGGHIGPLASLVLWDTMVDTLVERVRTLDIAEEVHVLFAGGIHDARSAAMVSTLAAPLSALGVRVGVLMGSAYLFTDEIVGSGATVELYRTESLRCRETVGLETGTGHASRCANTGFAEHFISLKRQMHAEGKSNDEIREVLEELNLGRLRLASKGEERSGADKRLVAVDSERQRTEGMYMLGQVAAIIEHTYSVAELHQRVGPDSCDFLRASLDAARLDRQLDEDVHTQAPADIALVGIGALLPEAGDVREYWQNILDKVEAIREIPEDRWDYRLYFDPDRQAPDKIYSKWGGFLREVAFDPFRYGMPPRAIKAVDPMQLMALEVIHQTIEDAGYAERVFDRERVSVVLGASGGAGDVGAQYAVRSELTRFAGELDPAVAERLPSWSEDSFAGILLNVAAGRAANRLDFGGLNYTVDAACASSLAAIYQGVIELEDGRSDMVIAGGVDTVQGPFGYLCFSKTQALSPRGRCATFDAQSDGIVISEGIAMVALKRLADAERDGDRIYAVIKGVGGSSDGRARSMTAPHPDGQIRALRRAYDKAGYSPATVGMFEAHGTGTVAGDTAELETVTRLLTEAGAAPRQSLIGSVKTMIGHTKATAGVAGLIKAALALYHRVQPPHRNVTTPNPALARPESPLYLSSEVMPWIAEPGHPRRAGVSAFGFGGTNFHVTLEEYRDEFVANGRSALKDRWHHELLVFRSVDRAGLAKAVRRVLRAFEQGAEPALRDLAYTLYRALPPAGITAAMLVADDGAIAPRLERLAAHLDDPAAPQPPGVFVADEPLASAGRIAFVYAGQGAQYPNMLREVATLFGEIPEAIGAADAALAEARGTGLRLGRLIYPPGLYREADEAEAAAALRRPDIAQPALGAVEVGLTRLLAGFGVSPQMAAGHSFGEYVALHAAGALTTEALFRVSEARGRFIVDEADGAELGAMLAVRAAREDVMRVAQRFADVLVANHNAPQQSILSGSRASIEAIHDTLIQDGIKARVLNVGAAFHSPFVAKARDRLAAFMDGLAFHTPAIPVYSNTTARAHAAEPATIRQVMAEHLVSPVEFVAQVERMYEDGARVFVGVGPTGVIKGLIEQILDGRPRRVVSVDDESGGLAGLLGTLGALLAEGVQVDLQPLFRGRDVRHYDLAKDPKGATRAVVPPPHAWWLSGSGARPVSAPPPTPLRVEDVARRAGVNGAATAMHGSAGTDHQSNGIQTGPVGTQRDAVPRPATQPIAQQQEPAMTNQSPPPDDRSGERAHTHVFGNPNTAQTPPAPMAHSAPPAFQGEREAVMAAYQQTMRQFLETQEGVMLAYLTGAPAHAVGRGAPQGSTGAYRGPSVQRPMAPMAMSHAAPPPPQPAPAAAVPSAPPAATPPEPVAPSPAAPPVPPTQASDPSPSTAAGNEAAAVESPEWDRAAVTAALLEIVEDRTGYPQDMLDLDSNMEADLGIDSIKRVEIVGGVLKRFPDEAFAELGDGGASAALNEQKSLRGMVDWLVDHIAVSAGTSAPFDHTEARDESFPTTGRAAVPRFEIQARPEPLPEVALEALEPGAYLVVGGQAPVAEGVAEGIRAAGGDPVIVAQPALEAAVREDLAGVSADASAVGVALARALEEASRRNPVRGLVYLGACALSALRPSDDAERWRFAHGVAIKGLFLALRHLSPALSRGGRVLAASALGGLYARGVSGSVKGQPAFGIGGGQAGLVKSLHEEWPDLRCKSVDLDPEQPTGNQVDTLLQEFRLPGGRIEVGYPGGTRHCFATVALPIEATALAPERLAPNAVILATGGARGITAETLTELAAQGRTLVLLGRSPLPDPEPPAEAALTDPAALRRLLFDRARAEGDRPRPVEVEHALERRLRDREIRANLASFRQAGARVDYRVVDVRDEAAVEAVIDAVYAAYGRIDGLVHGAGVIEDRLLVDKTPESWFRVFDTKVDSTLALVRRLRGEQLRFAVFFTSVAGRYGNSGQTDYAAANETVNRLACQLPGLWGPGVKVAALNWGPWLGTRHGSGMVSAQTRAKFEARGVELVPPAGGRAAFRSEVLGPMGAVEVVLGAGPWEHHEAEIGAIRAAAEPARSDDSGPLRPLPLLTAVGGQRTGDTGESILERRLDLATDPYLAEHRLDGVAVLPAAVALELMAEAAALVWPNWQVSAVRDLRVMRGVKVEEGGYSIEIVALASSHGDARGFEGSLEIRPAGGGLPHYRMTVELANELPEPDLYFPSIQPGAAPGLTPQRAYRELLFHGPRFQVLRSVLGLDATGAIADLATREPGQWIREPRPVRPWLFDPGAVDAAAQMALLWAHHTRGESALPSRFGQVQRFGDGALGACRMFFQLRDPADLGPNRVLADVAFVDSEDQLRLLMLGLESTSSEALNRLGGSWTGAIVG